MDTHVNNLSEDILFTFCRLAVSWECLRLSVNKLNENEHENERARAGVGSK